MKMFKKLAMVAGVSSLLVLSACDASVSDTDATSTDTTTGGGSDTTGGGTDTTTAAKKYSWVIIDGSKDPDCTTNSPGPDIDAVALYRNNKLIGMGKPGTQLVKSPSATVCGDKNDHDTSISVCGPVDGTVSATVKDTGYFGLANRSVYVQIGACSTATEDLKKCDGAGAIQDIMEGDELAVWEVDQSYKVACGGANDAPQCGYAYDKCTCTTEKYGVGVGTTSDSGDFLDLGVQTGTNMYIKVKKQ